MCQCRPISCIKYTGVAEDSSKRGGTACVGVGGIWEISVACVQFCYKLKTALRTKVY